MIQLILSLFLKRGAYEIYCTRFGFFEIYIPEILRDYTLIPFKRRHRDLYCKQKPGTGCSSM